MSHFCVDLFILFCDLKTFLELSNAMCSIEFILDSRGQQSDFFLSGSYHLQTGSSRHSDRAYQSDNIKQSFCVLLSPVKQVSFGASTH